MSDDWCLKDHKGKAVSGSDDNKFDIYFGATIDVLREKLMDDLEKAWKHIDSQKDKTNREYWFMTEWKASLDKRFGVKE